MSHGTHAFEPNKSLEFHPYVPVGFLTLSICISYNIYLPTSREHGQQWQRARAAVSSQIQPGSGLGYRISAARSTGCQFLGSITEHLQTSYPNRYPALGRSASIRRRLLASPEASWIPFMIYG